MEPLKEMFNKEFFKELSLKFNKHDKNFNKVAFLKEILTDLESLSLNQRMRQTSLVLKKYLPADFIKSLEIMYKVIPEMRSGYTNLLFPDFVGLYGGEHFEHSMDALKYFTTFGSSEFAIREFLKRDFNKTIKVMLRWSKDNNAHVRRLSSEGSRARLPWSFKLDEVIKNPKVTSQILENLKNDDSLYVRKSVANHLNDFSKDNPEYMIDMVSQWDQSEPHTAWIVKHASRSLIKKGNVDSLSIFNYEKDVKIAIDNFKISISKLQLGEYLNFSFDLTSLKKTPQKLVVDYIIHYQKSSGKLAPKVFKLTDMILLGGQTVTIKKKQLFKDFTTRKHFGGQHLLELQVNGKVVSKLDFHLTV